MTELDAARYIERAGALALVLGVAVAMSAQPDVRARRPLASAPRSPVAASACCPRSRPRCARRLHESPGQCPRPTQIPASGGWAGVISAILVAFRRRPPANAGVGSESGLSLMGRLRSIFGRGESSEGRSPAPAPTPDLEAAPITTVQTVAEVGPVRDIALSPDGRYAYVAASRPSRDSDIDTWAIQVVDTETNSVVKTIDDLGDIVPRSLAASPDSSRLYVADRNAAAIRVIDIREGSPTRNRVVDSLRLEGSLPVGYGTPAAITLSPNGSRLYALMTDSAVLIVDPDSRVSDRNCFRRRFDSDVFGGRAHLRLRRRSSRTYQRHRGSGDSRGRHGPRTRFVRPQRCARIHSSTHPGERQRSVVPRHRRPRRPPRGGRHVDVECGGADQD